MKIKLEVGQTYFRKSPARKKSGHPQLLQVLKVLAGPNDYNNYTVEYIFIESNIVERKTSKFFSGSRQGDDSIVPISKATKTDLKRFIISIFQAIRIKNG